MTSGHFGGGGHVPLLPSPGSGPENGLINWSERHHIPKMKVKTAPSQNGPIFFFFFFFFCKCIDKQTDNLSVLE